MPVARPTILPHSLSWTCLGCVDLREPPMFGDHGRKIRLSLLAHGRGQWYAILVPGARILDSFVISVAHLGQSWPEACDVRTPEAAIMATPVRVPLYHNALTLSCGPIDVLSYNERGVACLTLSDLVRLKTSMGP